MRILVVGGAGYVGSHTVAHLVAAGHDVTVYDDLSTGHAESVHGCRLVVGSLHDTDRLTTLMREGDIDAVMHFAAFALVGESVTDPAKYYSNNVAGSLSLLEAMRAADVRRLVFSSTTATYGQPEHVPIRETEPQQPINPYGFSKLVVERMMADYAAAYGLGYAALRYFNAAGAAASGQLGEDHDPETHLIPLVLKVALGQREAVTVFGDDYDTPDGTCIRDYVHVDDLADAHARALEQIEDGSGLCVNLGSGTGASVWEIIEACRSVTGHNIPANAGPRRAGDPPRLVADVSLASRLLGWQPRHSVIEHIVATAWRWHASHPLGYRSAPGTG
ncbi:MAG: UDP-glucose 4-epimerase GalE [Planctomycetales bacterium]|nr:UDP-glucose 4-epimerase GalE [Planctomycetales bacterium]